MATAATAIADLTDARPGIAWGSCRAVRTGIAHQRQSIERERATRGHDAVIDGCIAILAGHADDVDGALIVALGGPAAHRILHGDSRADGEVWQRTWALRGLLWLWDDRASVVLGVALSDRFWRVREMAVRVTRRHLLGEHLTAIAALGDDPVARVRAVAEDAVRRITAAGA